MVVVVIVANVVLCLLEYPWDDLVVPWLAVVAVSAAA
jgi:hypothetical protein